MPLTTKDALLERMVTATENLVTNILAKLDEYLPLSGGTMTGGISWNVNEVGLKGDNNGNLTYNNQSILTDGVTGNIVTKTASTSTSITANTATQVTSVSLTAGKWIVTGHVQYTNTTSDKAYGAVISTTADSFQWSADSACASQASFSGNLGIQTCAVLSAASDFTAYLNAYATVNATVVARTITAIRIA